MFIVIIIKKNMCSLIYANLISHTYMFISNIGISISKFIKKRR